MRSRNVSLALIAVGLVLVLPRVARAQSAPNQINPGNATGIQPYNTYGGVRENINLATGNLNLQVPLLTLPGRNGHDLVLGLEYDSKMWSLHYFFDPETGFEYYEWEYEGRSPALRTPSGFLGDDLGWRLNIPVLQSSWRSYGVSGSLSCQADFIVTLGDGSKHSFRNRANCWQTVNGRLYPSPASSITVSDSDDASYLRLDTSNESDVVLHLKGGTQIHFFTTFPLGGGGYSRVADKINDPNGNSITIQQPAGRITSITDTVGRVISFNWAADNALSSISYKDSVGIPRTIAFQFSNISIAPTFSLPAGSEPGLPFTARLPSAVTLPNGLSYTFQYNNFGELTKVTYPTGGYTRYDYAAFTHWWQMWGGGSAAADFREVTARRVCREAGGVCGIEDTTMYTPTVDSTKSNNEYVDVRDPEGNRTRHRFSFMPSGSVSRYFSPRELNRWIYQGESALLRATQTDYNELDTGGRPQNWSLPIRATSTLSDTNQVSKVEWDYDTYTALLPAATLRPIDNPTEQREYDFGTGAPGPLMRRTVNTWLKVNPINGQDYRTTVIWILDRKASEAVYNGGGTLVAQAQFEYDSYTEGLTGSGAAQHEASFGPAYVTRGNLTAIKRWRNTDSAWLTTRNQFDDAGNLRKSTDPLGHATTFSYADSWANAACTPSGGSAAAYLTSATNPLGHVSSSTYNSCSGTVASTTDPNSRTTTFGYDLMGRLTQTNFPDGGQASRTFNEAFYPLSVTTTTKINASTNLVTTVVVDGLGRPTQTRLDSDPEGVVYANTTYDPVGRRKTVSNPYRSTSDPTYGVTTFEYDALNRVTKVVPPDGSSTANNITTAYSGNTTTVTDQATKKRKSETDGVERLTRIWEPDPGGSFLYETAYQYDALDNLTRVEQRGNDPNSANWRTRTFTYNSLSLLTQATNPESGTVSYAYDNDSNLISRTDARNITTTYSYDALHRLTGKTYSDATPAVTFTFDVASVDGLSIQNPVGRLVKAATPTTRTVNSFDPMRRALTEWQCTPLNCGTGWFQLNYTYDLVGDMTSYTNGEGVSFTQTFNAAARLTQLASSLVDAQHPALLASGFSYYPQGAIKKMALGNGLTETTAFNNRLQPCRINVNSSAAALASCQDPAPTGNVLDFSYGFNQGSANNGNVMTWSAVGAQTFNRSYTYDELNRLKTMTGTGGQCTGLAWTYDIWANRTSQAVTGGTCGQHYPTISNLNRIVDAGYQYDPAGNMTAEPGRSYQYDAENHLVSVNSGATASYTYDAQSRRVRKVAGGVTTEYLYDLANNVVAEQQGSSWTVGYVYLGGQLLAQYKDNTTYFAHKDHLGSTRLLTRMDRTVQECLDYRPYGETEPCGGIATTTHKFTGKERDAETNLDYFGARYYSSGLGRFISPDEAPPNLFDPQSMNRYTYALNNPLRYVDPDGNLGPPWHLLITMTVLGNEGYDPDVASRVALINAGMDECCNTEEFAHVHSQARDGETAAEAKAGQEAFVDSSLDLAASAVLSGDYSEAEGSLGAALHPVQDEKHEFKPFREHPGDLTGNVVSAEGRKQTISDAAPSRSQQRQAARRTVETVKRFENKIRELGRKQGLSKQEIDRRIKEFKRRNRKREQLTPVSAGPKQNEKSKKDAN